MRKSLVIAGLVALLAACEKSSETFDYQVIRAGDGVESTTGQLVIYDLKLVDANDSVWVDTYERGFPEIMQMGDSLKELADDRFSQTLGRLSKGDSVVFQSTTKELYAELLGSAVPPQVDSTLIMTYSVSIDDIINEEDFPKFRDEAMKKYQAVMEKRHMERIALAVEQLGKDTVTIDNYLAAQGLKAMKTSSGLRYIITKAGRGKNISPGQTASVRYAGYLLDGTYFDSNIKSLAEQKGLYDPRREPYNAIEVVVDRSSVIPGWHEAIKLMKNGAKATFFIPSPLAYGEQSRGDVIKENSILVFDMEITEVE